MLKEVMLKTVQEVFKDENEDAMLNATPGQIIEEIANEIFPCVEDIDDTIREEFPGDTLEVARPKFMIKYGLALFGSAGQELSEKYGFKLEDLFAAEMKEDVE